MITICHVTSVHRAFDGRIFKKECKSLSARYDVYLVAPNVVNQDVEGVKVVGVSLPKGRIKRMLKLNRVYKTADSIDAEVYHFHDPELIPIARRFKRKGKRVIFDSHEDIPSDILEKKYIPKPLRRLVSILYGNYERRAFKRFDALITVTPTIVERLKKYNSKTFQVTNYPIYKDILVSREKENYVCFTGAVSSLWQIDTLINSLDGLETKLVLAGPFSDSYREELSHLPSWDKVEYKGFVDAAEVERIQKNAIAGMAVLKYGKLFGDKMGTLGNTKLFEYMMNGTPVIATDFVLWKEIFDSYHCGLCVNPYDCRGIAAAIDYLRSNPNEAIEMGNNGKMAVRERYNWAQQEKILFAVYETVLN